MSHREWHKFKASIFKLKVSQSFTLGIKPGWVIGKTAIFKQLTLALIKQKKSTFSVNSTPVINTEIEVPEKTTHGNYWFFDSSVGTTQTCDAACHVQQQMFSDNTGKKKSSSCSCLRYNSIKPNTKRTPPLKTKPTVFYISLKAPIILVFVSRLGLSSSAWTPFCLLVDSQHNPVKNLTPFKDLLILRTIGCLNTNHTPWVFIFLAIVKKSHSLFNRCSSHGQRKLRWLTQRWLTCKHKSHLGSVLTGQSCFSV